MEVNDAEYLPIGNKGTTRVPALGQGRAEPQGRRGRSAAIRAGGVEDDRPRAQGGDRERRPSSAAASWRSISSTCRAGCCSSVWTARRTARSRCREPGRRRRRSADARMRRTSGTASARRSCRRRSTSSIPATKKSDGSRSRRRRSTPASSRRKALFATSKDGTRVPFFLTAKKNLPLDGNNPTMLYGYGGFSVSTLPTYRQDVPAWLERGGVWVTASMRGGAEYGEAWHQAGMLEKKQNVFDDFIAVAEQLVQGRSTRRRRSWASWAARTAGCWSAPSWSSGRICLRSRCPAVGVMDMLRFDKFTGGALWTTEYGSASNPAQFPFLIKYSPVQNIKPGTCYPATLITTADHDDRVVPSHSFKFAAALQAAQGCDEAGADPRRGAGLARLSADGQADRRARGSVGLRGRADGDALISEEAGDGEEDSDARRRFRGGLRGHGAVSGAARGRPHRGRGLPGQIGGAVGADRRPRLRRRPDLLGEARTQLHAQRHVR